MFGRPQSGDPNLQQSIRYLEDQLRKGGSSGSSGTITRIADVSLVAGNNTIYHGLGRKPQTWWVAAPEGAFPTSGGSTIYLPAKPPSLMTLYKSNPTGSTTGLGLTVTNQPTVGNHAILNIGVRCATTGTYPNITSVTSTGMTWALVARQVYNPSSYSATEVWLGSVDSTPSGGVTVTFSGTHAGSYYAAATISEMQDLDGTVIATASGDSYTHAFSSVYKEILHSDNVLTTPSASAGNVVYSSLNVLNNTAPVGATNGWDVVDELQGLSSSNLRLAGFQHTAIRDGVHPLIMNNMANNNWLLVYAVLGATVGTVATGGSTPHGFREVSSDASTLVINSIGACTADIMVQ